MKTPHWISIWNIAGRLPPPIQSWKCQLCSGGPGPKKHNGRSLNRKKGTCVESFGFILRCCSRTVIAPALSLLAQAMIALCRPVLSFLAQVSPDCSLQAASCGSWLSKVEKERCTCFIFMTFFCEILRATFCCVNCGHCCRQLLVTSFIFIYLFSTILLGFSLQLVYTSPLPRRFLWCRRRTKRGLMAEYESTTQKYNLAAGQKSTAVLWKRFGY